MATACVASLSGSMEKGQVVRRFACQPKVSSYPKRQRSQCVAKLHEACAKTLLSWRSDRQGAWPGC